MSNIAGVGVIIESFENIQFSRYTCGAAMTVMVYDYFLTVGDEVKYVWSGRQKMTLAKFMFVWNRYLVFPWVLIFNYHLSGFRGRLNNRLFVFSIFPVMAVVQGLTMVIGIQLLALRVLPLYKNDRRVRIGLFTWLSICHIALWVMVGISMMKILPVLLYLPMIDSCYTVADRIVGGVYVPPLLAEGSMFLLQIVDHVRRRKQTTLIKTPLLSTLFRDGYIYFSAILSLRIICVFVYGFGPTSLWFIANQMDFPIAAALISRFFIQLRGAAMEDDVAMHGTNHHFEMSHQQVNSQSHFQSSRVGIGSVVRFTQQAEHEYHPTDILYLDNSDKVLRHDYPAYDAGNTVRLQELRRMRTTRVAPRY
ncbi:hypothetical protein CPB86DRAFT_595795 [Serendipita vermifera]|nr:hypothetical protein CPB86DRAFT_595795 [Serendipita vermifera]